MSAQVEDWLQKEPRPLPANRHTGWERHVTAWASDTASFFFFFFEEMNKQWKKGSWVIPREEGLKSPSIYEILLSCLCPKLCDGLCARRRSAHRGSDSMANYNSGDEWLEKERQIKKERERGGGWKAEPQDCLCGECTWLRFFFSLFYITGTAGCHQKKSILILRKTFRQMHKTDWVNSQHKTQVNPVVNVSMQIRLAGDRVGFESQTNRQQIDLSEAGFPPSAGLQALRHFAASDVCSFCHPQGIQKDFLKKKPVSTHLVLTELCPQPACKPYSLGTHLKSSGLPTSRWNGKS